MTLAGRSLVRAVALCVAVVTPASCGDSDPNGPTPPTPRPFLAGKWTGISNYGDGTQTALTITLRADSTVLARADNLPVCHFAGAWTVTATQFTATGHDCIGNPMTIAAPASSSHLVGTWIVGDGTNPAERGWFDVSKY
jgi:hypothetical protein